MLQIPRVLPLVFCLGSAKAVQCPRNGPKTGDKSQQILRYAPVCPRGQPLGMAPDKCIKKATCLMTTTQYNSNNSLTAEFKELLSKKEIKAEERFVIQISFRRHNLESASKITADSRSTVHSKSARFTAQIHTIRALFKAKSVDPKTYSPPSFCCDRHRIRGGRMIKTCNDAVLGPHFQLL